MKRIFFSCLFFVLFGLFTLTAQSSLRFSDSVQISLITASPGQDLYSQFGHSIIRVIDYKFRTDLAFNYGTFDFDTPNFYGKFMQGKLNYQLAVHSMERTFRAYNYEQRLLEEQVLQLSPTEQQAVLDFLVFNAQPENREYLYDFFYDNCATRIRDIFEKEVNGFVYTEAEVEDYTFRQMLALYVGDHSWINFGFSLILGYPTDQVANMREQMFLPDYLSRNLTQFARNDGSELLSASKPINNVTLPEDSSSWLTPIVVTILLLLLSLLLLFKGTPKAKRIFDTIFFSVLSVLGIIMVFMWFGTDHWTTTKNLNVLWANPLFLVFLILKKRRWLALLAIVMGAALLAIGWFLPQQFHLAFVPIWLAMMARGVDYLRVLK
jgi:hypothetical protein